MMKWKENTHASISRNVRFGHKKKKNQYKFIFFKILYRYFFCRTFLIDYVHIFLIFPTKEESNKTFSPSNIFYELNSLIEYNIDRMVKNKEIEKTLEKNDHIYQ